MAEGNQQGPVSIYRKSWYGDSSAQTNVTVVGIADKALNGIYDAIHRQGDVLEKLTQTVEDQGDDDRRDRNSDRVASLAAERRNRAVNNALLGTINKGFDGVGLLKKSLVDAINDLKNVLINNFKQSMKSFSDLSKQMRQNNLTRDQKNLIQGYVGTVQANVEATSGIKLMSSEINQFMSELMDRDLDLRNLTDEQRSYYAAARKRGIDQNNAFSLAMSANEKNYKDLSVSIQKMSDRSVGGRVNATLASLTAADIANMGGAAAALDRATELARGLAENQTWLTKEASAEMSKIQMMLDSNQLERLSDSDKTSIAAFGLRKGMSGTDLAEALRKAASSGKDISVLQRILANQGLMTENLSASLLNAKSILASGGSLRSEIRSDKENMEADTQNTANGRIAQGIDKFLHTGVLGKTLGGLSNALDEWFGEDISIEQVVSHGFKITIGLLTAMLASNVFKRGAEIASGIAGVASNLIPIKGASNVSAVGKGAKLLKAGKALPVVGVIAGVGAVAYDFIDAANFKAADISTDLNSKAFKEEESKLQKEQKNAKYVGATLKAGAALAGAAAGVKLGAAIGSVVPGLGTAIGGVVGAGIGAAGGVLVDNIVDANNNLKDTQLRVKGLDDLDDRIQKISKSISELKEGPLRDQLVALKENTEAQRNKLIQDLNQKEREHWQKMTGGTSSDILKAIRENLNAADAEYDKNKAEVNRLKYEKTQLEGASKDSGLTEEKRAEARAKLLNLEDKLTLAEANLENSYQQLIGSRAALNMGISKDLADKYNTTNASEIAALAFNSANKEGVWDQTSFENTVLNNLVDELDQGTFGNDLRKHIASLNNSQLYEFLKGIAEEHGIKSEDKIAEFIKIATEEAAKETGNKEWLNKFNKWQEASLALQKQQLDKAGEPVEISGITTNAYGGVYNKLTSTIIGEDGKEAVLPLTKPGALMKVLSSLTQSERFDVLKALIKGGFSGDGVLQAVQGVLNRRTTSSQSYNIPSGTAPGDDPATIEKILGYAGPYRWLVYNKIVSGFKQREKWYQEAISNSQTSEGKDLIRGTYAERALTWGLTQLGLPYILRSLGKIGYVCNEFTDAAMRASGFDMKDFRIHSVGATFGKLISGKTHKLKDGSMAEYPAFRLRPDLTPETAPPGMVFFATQKRKGKDAAPGHIGLVYYGHQIMHSAGGSSDYTREGFLPNWQTPCRGVTVTPYSKNCTYQFGEFPGFFEQATGETPEWMKDPSIKFGPYYGNMTALEEQKKLAKQAIESVIAVASGETKQVMLEYAKQAYELMNNGNIREVLESMGSIIKYLRDIASSPSNKKPNPVLTKVMPTVFK